MYSLAGFLPVTFGIGAGLLTTTPLQIASANHSLWYTVAFPRLQVCSHPTSASSWESQRTKTLKQGMSPSWFSARHSNWMAVCWMWWEGKSYPRNGGCDASCLADIFEKYETPRDHKHFLKNVFEFSGCSTVCRDIRFEDVFQAERHHTHRCKEDWYLPWGMCPILCSQRRSHGGIRVWAVLWLVCCDVLLHPMHSTSMRLLQSDCYSWWPKHKGASYK